MATPYVLIGVCSGGQAVAHAPAGNDNISAASIVSHDDAYRRGPPISATEDSQKSPHNDDRLLDFAINKRKMRTH